ncbi:MAG: type II toxin-antitoxin system Phd/YefM family antitoxin [Spirochaetia bacterium]|nr:type II toxin-antitoxin system Phd/YefM family antitoxin [Spirochaetia bacterium]MCI7798187.1 type II toxin-antitoxin system Phd/YefM family antitoxin [Spirochaetia bacterium]
MVTFARNEIVSSSQFVRNFASLLQRVTKSNNEKIAIVKNNQMQAVMIPIDEYERLATLAEKAEQKAIFETIQERKNTPVSEYISYDDAMKMAGL